MTDEEIKSERIRDMTIVTQLIEPGPKLRCKSK